MKDIIIKHKVVFVLIAVLIVILVLLGIGNTVVTTIDPNATTTVFGIQKATSTAPAASNTTVSSPKPVVSTPGLKMTISKDANYDAYMQQLGDNKRKCEIYAENLYNKTYAGTLESVTYSDSYNEDNGQCYLEVVGQKTSKDSFGRIASTTQNFYFRNAITGSLLADCVREGNSVGVNENQYICTDKVTGKRILKVQYDNLLASYK